MAKYIIDQVVSKEGKKTFSQYSEIQNLIYPIGVGVGVPFTISYEALNKLSKTQRLFGYITDSGFNIIPSSQWEQTIPPMSRYYSNTQIQGIEEDLEGVVIIGHIEGAIEASAALILIPVALIVAAIILYK